MSASARSAVLICVPLMSDEPFLRLQLVRRQMDPPQCRPAADRLAARRAGIDIRSGLANKRVAFADGNERQMRERREVATRADAALFGNRRHDRRGCNSSTQCVEQFGRHAGVALGQRLNAQREGQPGDAERQQAAHADGMAAQQILLQREDLMLGDALIRKFAEAGVDAIDRFAARSLSSSTLRERITRSRSRRGELQRIDPAVEQTLGIGQRQTVAGQREGLSPGFSRHVGIIETSI